MRSVAVGVGRQRSYVCSVEIDIVCHDGVCRAQGSLPGEHTVGKGCILRFVISATLHDDRDDGLLSGILHLYSFTDGEGSFYTEFVEAIVDD